MVGAFLTRSIALGSLLLSVATPRSVIRNPVVRYGAVELPAGTVLVAHDPFRSRTYFSTSQRLGQWENGREIYFKKEWQLFSPEAILFSGDGKLLILRDAYDSFVLQLKPLRLQHHLSNTRAWWEGSRLGFFDYYNGVLFTGGRKLSVRWGRTELIALNATGRYFLGARRVRDDSVRTGLPRYRLQLWKRTGQGTLQLVRTLTAASFDPASEEYPRYLEALDRQVVVFGFPNGGADGQDYVGVWRRGHVIAPLKDAMARPLQFSQWPIVTRNVIIGIAEAIGYMHTMTGRKYFYQISDKEIILKPLPKNVAFVTYDAKRDAVGWGVKGRTGISLRYR